MAKFLKISLLLVTGVILSSGCAKRSNPIIPVVGEGDYLRLPAAPGGIATTALASALLQVADPAGKRSLHAYLPPGHPAIFGRPPSRQKYPVLYLLADFNQNTGELGGFYQLQRVADELLASGEMDSLVIILISGDMQVSTTDLGGTFYGNSILIGDWLTFTQQVITQIDTFYLSFNTDPARRAIAGLGMGGYGAFRVALEYDTLFDVVGALSAPLALGGTDASGWLQNYLMPEVLSENNNIYDSIKAATPFDPAKPATSWMIAMAAAFSPRTDTLDKSGVTYRNISGNYGVDIPFDASGLVGSLVNLWMANDIENLLNTAKAGALTGKKVYFDCGDADEFELAAVNLRFSQFLGQGTHTYVEYSGYTGHNATHNQFAYDRLKELLKFVSANM